VITKRGDEYQHPQQWILVSQHTGEELGKYRRDVLSCTHNNRAQSWVCLKVRYRIEIELRQLTASRSSIEQPEQDACIGPANGRQVAGEGTILEIALSLLVRP